MSRRELLRQTLLVVVGGTLLETAFSGCSVANNHTHPSSSLAYPLVFPTGFLWGASTSAYQIEGAAHADGRGASIWDTFSHTPGKTVDGATGDVADDHYHRYESDFNLLHALGVKSYRFSIAWPRIFPDGAGALNQPGLDFYRRLVESLLQRGIRPMATLFHWDLPQALQDQGGWENRDVAKRFADYADTLFQALGDLVPAWLTVNEPKTIVTQGYISGTHAPGIQNPARAYVALHHLLLGHGLATQAFRARFGRDGSRLIGPALNLSPVYPADHAEGTAAAVTLQDGIENRLYLDPIFKGSYPTDVVEALGDTWPSAAVIQDGDLAIIHTPIDHLGVNYYNPLVVTAGPQFVNGVYPTTQASWEQIYPNGLYDILMRLTRDYDRVNLYITENGAPYPDTFASQTVDDPQRIVYLHDHLVAAYRAIQAGAQLRGYHLWSLLDNFEWAEGYSQRWGIVYVDFATQQRYPKQSAHWYSEVIRQHGLAQPQG